MKKTMNKTNILVLLTLLFAYNTAHAEIKRKLPCNGKYKSKTCSVIMYVDNCHQKIKFTWPALRYPGNPQWAAQHQNFCQTEITKINGLNQKPTVVLKHKLKPETCNALFSKLEQANNENPDAEDLEITSKPTKTKQKDLDQKICSLPQDYQGYLYASIHKNHYTVKLETLSRCTLTKTTAQCPVLSPPIETFFKEILTPLQIAVEIKNPLR